MLLLQRLGGLESKSMITIEFPWELTKKIFLENNKNYLNNPKRPFLTRSGVPSAPRRVFPKFRTASFKYLRCQMFSFCGCLPFLSTYSS